MQTAVVYYSLGGATRSYARAEADARMAQLIEVRPQKPYNPFTAFVRGCPDAMHQKAVPLAQTPDLSVYSRIVLLAPIWAGQPAPPFYSVVACLPRGCEVEVILTSGSGNSQKCADRVRALVEGAGCRLIARRDIRTAK